MVWQAVSVEEKRREFVELAHGHTLPFRQLCDRFGISPPTGYKWMKRADRSDDDDDCWTQDRSSRPRSSPTQTDPAIEVRVVALRQAHPSWGGRKLRALLLREGIASVPAPSTITNILHRHGLIDRAASEQRQHPRRFEHPNPNDLWQLDFMGHLALGTAGNRLHVLTLLD